MSTQPTHGAHDRIPDDEQEDAPLVVRPAPGSRLTTLHAEYADAKATADEATARLKVITDGIKAELTQLAPEATKVELQTGIPGARPMRLTYSESWRLDSKRLKAEHPETWVRYAKKGGSWTLRAVGGEE